MSEETLRHIKRVNELLLRFCMQMQLRAIEHDESKLLPPEAEGFERVTGKLKNLTYGSEEYKKSLEELQPILEYHYDNNSHHPEHYVNGIKGMDLFDIVEMFFDWKAATERHTDGCIFKSIKLNKERFKYSDDIEAIFINTAERYDLDNDKSQEKED